MCLEIYWGLIIVVISKYRQISSFFWNLISLDFLFDRIVQLFLLFTRALLFLNISIFYLLRQEDSTFNVYENSTLVTRVLACKILDMLLESRLSKISKKEKKKEKKEKREKSHKEPKVIAIHYIERYKMPRIGDPVRIVSSTSHTKFPPDSENIEWIRPYTKWHEIEERLFVGFTTDRCTGVQCQLLRNCT